MKEKTEISKAENILNRANNEANKNFGHTWISACSPKSEMPPASVKFICPPLPTGIIAESTFQTPLPKTGELAKDFAGRLLINELRKNRVLKRSILIYNLCRSKGE